MQEVFHRKAVHPAIHIDIHCRFPAGSGTAIDPLLPAEGIECGRDALRSFAETEG